MRFSWLYHLSAIGIRGIGLVSKFLLVLCLVRYFQPSDLGLYGIMAAMVAYALFFLGMEYYNHASRALIDAPPATQAIIIRDQFVLYAVVYLLLSPVFYGLFYNHILPRSLCGLFFLLVTVEHISNELMRVLIVLSRPYLANVVYFIRQGAWIILLLPLFYFVPASRHFNAVFLAWIIGALCSILAASIGLRHLPWRATWRKPIRWLDIWQGLKVSRPFMVSAFCALSMLYIERFFVDYYCGLSAVGIYTFYAGLSLTLHNLVNTGVSKMRLAPLLAAWKQNNRSAFHDESMRMLKETGAFVVLFVAFSLCLIYPFVNFINKPIYLTQLPIFYFLLFGAACRSIADIPLYTLYAQHSDRLLLLINLGAFCILLIGNAVLVPRYGLTGAALSSAAASLTLLIYALSVMIQRIRTPYPHLQS
ncbi:MAG TPA: hypothetical protein DDY37_07150 [Legionella sp.]|nr:hypothetical protein [Legionella sp.]